MKKEELSKWLLAGVLFIPAASDPQYLDPGSGSLILQLIIAGAAAVSYAFRHSIGRLFKVFRRNKDEDATDPDNEE
ncbi:MAG: hypothetical protein KJZ53_05135 [Anaerolineales bacterium]|nr:hypothetical protein [Anaerolineales bacterium]MCL4257899.1 hypothetical protein [Anaerolineales bacterium]